MLSNMQVLCEVAGGDIFGLFSNLQKFLIEKCKTWQHSLRTSRKTYPTDVPTVLLGAI